MKIGKIPENVLKRSVLKQLHTKRQEVVLGAGVGEDCAAVKLAADEMFVLSTDPITGTVEDIGKLAIQITLNDLASAGASPIGVLLTILLPEDTTEAGLKEIMTEVTAAVNQAIITVCGVGKVKDGKVISTAGARAGMDILVTKWIGIEGTSIIAKEQEKRLRERFSVPFIESAKGLDRFLSVLPEAEIAVRCGVCAMHDVTEGGIFGALWEMAEASGVGLEIDVKKIPIRQETVEVCEFFGINPYQLISSGCMLMAAENGMTLQRELEKAGICASVIGKATEGNDRVLLNEDERRFLEPPKTDELYKV